MFAFDNDPVIVVLQNVYTCFGDTFPMFKNTIISTVLFSVETIDSLRNYR